MEVIKALQGDSLKQFKAMKYELENLKLQQYPGHNVTDMSLGVTYHCQARSTAGIRDHQLCSSMLSAFLLANSDEMYHHSHSMNSRRLDSWSMLLETPKTAAKDLPMPTSVTLLKLGTKNPRVWVSGLLPHMPWTPRHDLCLQPKLKSMPLSSGSKKASPPLSCETRLMTLATFVAKKSIGPMNVQTRLALKPTSL